MFNCYSFSKNKDLIVSSDVGTYPDVCICVLLHEDPMITFDLYESILQDMYPSAFADPLLGEAGEPMGLEIKCTSKRLDRVPEGLPTDTFFL